ncbi:Transcription factor hamlet [Gossypium australe]|uniref:Transcription factor hamlet n=1 Tax=Gossypium australe TaxID=47621 RepID=A0A5B6UP63_9ROSI|nr:Transcription factor hamlet [Gossypium australe]
MPVAKLKAANSANLMKSEDLNDSLDTFIRQAIGKEPFLPFSRTGDSPVQWIQLLHALDQQDIPGWPLLSPLKVQTQKCDKCSREFCSPINYRRHIRVHHRLKKLDKDSAKNRDLLAAFWDKLSEDEAKEVVSFKDVLLEGVPGSSVIKSLTTHVKRQGFSALPQVCLRAGSALLDLVQARPSIFPISSQELFSILDDASERTFLCGAAVSMQKYIFDGEAGKIGLETKNLVACTSFLVKAWLADKDAEALRCQKLLVEEEEAAQKRQVELLERKRQKKLRQKEQKAKEQRHWELEESKLNMDDLLEVNTLAETSSPSAVDSDGQNPVMSTDQIIPSVEPNLFSKLQENVDYEIQTGFSNGYSDPGISQNIESRTEQVGRRHIVVARRQTPPNSQRGVLNDFHASQNSHGYASQNSHGFKCGSINKHGTNRERFAPIGNGNKIWSQKPKAVNEGESLKIRVEKQAANQLNQNKNHELLIGSISVTLENYSNHDGNNLAEACDRSLAECRIPKDNVQEKSSKLDPVQGVTNRSTIKFWRPVSRHESKSSSPVQNGASESEVQVIAEKDGARTSSNETCLRSCSTDDIDGVVSMDLISTLKESVQPESLQFDSHTVKAILAQRWKEALAGEHVTLVLTPNLDPPGCSEIEADSSEKLVVKARAFKASTAGPARGKFRRKPEKDAKIKYIPKQRSTT